MGVQCQQQETREKRSFLHSMVWHGIVWVVMILSILAVCGVLVYMTIEGDMEPYDSIPIGATWAALAIAVICSHSYNYEPRFPKGSLQDNAAKKQATWLHANYCWKILSVWMTVTPLYCTCATIYISGNYSGNQIDQTHVLVYSILSLVLSLGVYVIRPSNRATGYREAYLIITTALTVPESDLSDLAKALIEGEKVVAKQDTMDPS